MSDGFKTNATRKKQLVFKARELSRKLSPKVQQNMERTSCKIDQKYATLSCKIPLLSPRGVFLACISVAAV